MIIIISTKFMKITAHSTEELTDSNSKIQIRYGEAYSRLKVNHKFIGLNYFTWFLLRRSGVVITLIFMKNYPLLQIVCHILLGLVDFLILLIAKPFK